MEKSFSITNKTKNKLPKIPFETIKKATLGSKYNLSLVIADEAHLKKLNTIYRDKEFATDILSFPLSESEGEIYICLEEAKKEAVKFDRSYEDFLAFLFIHGCVHLKGYDHGSTMEAIEVELRKKFCVCL